jgi:hypothetical protein
MAAKIIPFRNRAQRCREVATLTGSMRISRHDAVRRLIAVARANALGLEAVTTEWNIAIVAEFDLFPEYGAYSAVKTTDH